MYLCCTHKHIVNCVCQQTDAKNLEFILKKKTQTIRADTVLCLGYSGPDGHFCFNLCLWLKTDYGRSTSYKFLAI